MYSITRDLLERIPWQFAVFLVLFFACGTGMLFVALFPPKDATLSTQAFAYFADGFKVTLGAVLGSLSLALKTGDEKKKAIEEGPS